MKRLSPTENGSSIIRKEMVDNIKILGENHPETVKTYQKLAMQLFKESQWEECLKYALLSMDRFEKDIEVILREEKKGFQNKVSAVAKEYEELGNLVNNVYQRSAEQIGERIKIIERVLFIFKQVFGQKSQYYAQQLQKKTKILFEKGDKVGSMACLEECMSTQKSILSEFHGDFAETYKLTGLLLSEYGLFQEGISYCIAALQVLEKQIQQYQQMQQQQLQYGISITPLSPYTFQQCQLENAHIKVLIATIYRKQNKLNEAINLLFEALKQQQPPTTQQIQQQPPNLRNDSKYYLLCLQELALNLRDCGRLEEAVDYAQKCLQLKKDTQNDYLDASENLASIYYLKGDLEKSRDIMTQIFPQFLELHENEPENQKKLKQLVELLEKLINSSRILGENPVAISHQRILERVLTKVAFRRKQRKVNLSFSESCSFINSNNPSVILPSSQQRHLKSASFHQGGPQIIKKNLNFLIKSNITSPKNHKQLKINLNQKSEQGPSLTNGFHSPRISQQMNNEITSLNSLGNLTTKNNTSKENRFSFSLQLPLNKLTK